MLRKDPLLFRLVDLTIYIYLKQVLPRHQLFLLFTLLIAFAALMV